ncbi:MAG TPA: hypothetical protein VNG90_02270 [Candidatus Acidoferrum sp.]|nr:hypothetical protein [Candidatus Acidoferrum sp.]
MIIPKLQEVLSGLREDLAAQSPDNCDAILEVVTPFVTAVLEGSQALQSWGDVGCLMAVEWDSGDMDRKLAAVSEPDPERNIIDLVIGRLTGKRVCPPTQRMLGDPPYVAV